MHIPKCAGTSVREQLSRFDSYEGAFHRGVVSFDGLGDVDTHHIPLARLKDHFPEAFEKIVAYEVFAILRDPFKRFPASMFQRLRMYGETDIAALSPKEILTATREITAELEAYGSDGLMPHDLIHFQPQATYVELDGQRFVKHLYRIDDLTNFFAAVDRQLGGVLEEDPERLGSLRSNPTRIFRDAIVGRLVSLVPSAVRYPLLGLTPAWLKERLRGAAFEPSNARLVDIMKDPEVARFVSSFYARDIALWQEIGGEVAQTEHAEACK
jgi:hypothetical protein